MSRFLFRRLAAYALDMATLFAVLAPLGFAVQRALGIGQADVTGLGIYLAAVLTFSVPSWAYFALADASARGQTLGKRALGLRASGVEGERVGRGRALGRTAVKLAPWEGVHVAAFVLPAVGAPAGAQGAAFAAVYLALGATLAVAWRSGGSRSLHDLAAGTRVVPTAEPARPLASV